MPIEANLSQILARRVMAAATLGDWPLVKSLADVLINLQERDLVTEAGRAAWAHERVREVPLVSVPMRAETPRVTHTHQIGLDPTGPVLGPVHPGDWSACDLEPHQEAPDTTTRRCSAKSGTAQCQRAAGHDGGHGYRSPTGAVAAWD